MKRFISILVASLFIVTGCSDHANFRVTEVSEYQENTNQFMKIVFTPEDIPKGAMLVAIKVGGY